MLMASLRDPYAAVGVGMLAASQLAQLNHLMMQQQQAHPPPTRSPSSQPATPLGGMPAGMPLALPMPRPGSPGTPPECHSPPISRTYTYKKVTKPLLERKRRARINRCLDELKELMVGALEAVGENVSKLEKADILELTVRHLQRITKPRDAAEDASRFQAGFNQCASEACHFLLGLPGLDADVGRRLVEHLSEVVTLQGAGLQSPQGLRPSGTAYSPPASPDLLLARQVPVNAPTSPAQVAGSSSRSVPPAQLSPSAEVSSSTSWTASCAASGMRLGQKRSLERSEEEDSEDDPYPDSDVPVNYTSEALSALSRQQQRKRPRSDPGVETRTSLGYVSSSAASPRASHNGSHNGSHSGSHSGSQSGSDDEDKGPMWRPW